ncbi:MAG TPA: hypothetical protein GX506_05560 [Firmicutes bacterium]|nr:hypothetical protein [Bacillota bacterium]
MIPFGRNLLAALVSPMIAEDMAKHKGGRTTILIGDGRLLIGDGHLGFVRALLHAGGPSLD